MAIFVYVNKKINKNDGERNDIKLEMGFDSRFATTVYSIKSNFSCSYLREGDECRKEPTPTGFVFIFFFLPFFDLLFFLAVATSLPTSMA